MITLTERPAPTQDNAAATPPAASARRPTLLAVDDTPENLLLLGELLDGPYDMRFARSGEQALLAMQMQPMPDLVLLDVMMPGMDGYEVLRRLRQDAATAAVPVIFVTAKDAFEDEERGLKLGAVDYVTKPINPTVLCARVATHLELKRVRDTLAAQNADLEAEVQRRMRETLLVQEVSIRALASLGETRDNETGHHIRRTQLYIDVLGRHLEHHPRFRDQLTPQRLKLIIDAAPLHDIGKIGIRDEILLKPGKLTPEEFAIMKTHAALGGEVIDRAIREVCAGRQAAGATDACRATPGGPLEFLAVAREIATGHHEKWDGSGYPLGLEGDAIPVSARLMALADVFDALISRRVYKAAFAAEDVRRTILAGRGWHFDPDIVDAYVAREADFLAIAARYADPVEPGA